MFFFSSVWLFGKKKKMFIRNTAIESEKNETRRVSFWVPLFSA